MKTDGSYYDKGGEIDFNNIWCIRLVGIDRGVASMLCTTVDLTTKGENEQPVEYVTKIVLNWLKKKSYRKVTFKTDAEPALLAVMERIKKARAEETNLIRTPTRSSPSPGAGQRAVRTVKEQFKVYRFKLEGKLGAPVLPTSPVWTWIGRHVAWVHDMFHAVPDGRTPCELFADVAYKGELYMFGGTVFMKEAIGKFGQGRYVAPSGHRC